MILNVLPASGQIIRFDWLSIVFIAIIILCGVIFAAKGLIKTVISLAFLALTIVLAVLVAKPLGNAMNSSFGGGMNDSISSWLLSKDTTVFSTMLAPDNKEMLLPLGLEAMGVSGSLSNAISKIILPLVPKTGATLAVCMANGFTKYIFIAIAFLIIWIFLLIVKAFIMHLFRKIPGLGIVSHVGGLILGLGVGFIIVSAVCYLLSIATFLPSSFTQWISTEMAMNNPDVWTISKAFYELDLVSKFINAYL